MAILRRESLEKWNGITVWEHGVDIEVRAEGGPKSPVPVGALLSSCNDATSHGLLTKQEVTIELITGRTWSSCQDTICG